ncbi:hypothetical protein [Streptomyces atroolivaceus]|uniref:hypothetical protein n=1 Tax=Streptomyces atroolivaceus TaxID=66869 RepID=UPI0020242CCB|nr:hypothetical protein [Streptomyces atroolivaceus]
MPEVKREDMGMVSIEYQKGRPVIVVRGGKYAPATFDVLVTAPEGVVEVSADSPYYPGTFALFGAPYPGTQGHGALAWEGAASSVT